jgi:hypothetical protein
MFAHRSDWHRDCEVCRPGGLTLNIQVVLALAYWFCLGGGATFGESRITAREGPSGDFLELEGQTQGRSSNTPSRSIGLERSAISAPV